MTFAYATPTQVLNEPFGNNLLSFSVVVNAPPSIEDVYCSAAFLSRGAYTICSVEATDDREVVNATLEWQILGENESINESDWTVLFMGKINPTVWETALVIPANASLGAVALRATVSDNNSMRAMMMIENVTRVVDAPPTWFGPHASGVDPKLEQRFDASKPTVGGPVPSSNQSTDCLRDGCRLQPRNTFPVFFSSRGTLGNVSYVPQSAANLYCYTADLRLEIGSELGDVDLEVRTNEGSLLLNAR